MRDTPEEILADTWDELATARQAYGVTATAFAEGRVTDEREWMLNLERQQTRVRGLEDEVKRLEALIAESE